MYRHRIKQKLKVPKTLLFGTLKADYNLSHKGPFLGHFKQIQKKKLISRKFIAIALILIYTLKH